jgi:RNA polymerase sigma factor (sigma-70 family)
MDSLDSGEPAGQIKRAEFLTTQWSMIRMAGGDDSPESQKALERLCQSYWYPVYAFVRRFGLSAPEAEDLTQDFFYHILRTNMFASADASKGRFRTFVTRAAKNFLSNDWKRRQTKKRGGGAAPISLDAEETERRYQLDMTDPQTPEKLFEQKWAKEVISVAFEKLEKDYSKSGQKARFEILRKMLWGKHSDTQYESVSKDLEMTVNATRVATSRLRNRFRELVRDELATQVNDPKEVDEEYQFLIQTLSS